nr:MAG TPA: hypothetical protein [Caudoviricetes sp.]
MISFLSVEAQPVVLCYSIVNVLFKFWGVLPSALCNILPRL